MASGQWVNDRTHGQQFKARFLRTSAPTSAEGIEKYLSSGMIRGVGPIYAKKLVRAFGEKVFDIIETAPLRLLARNCECSRSSRSYSSII
jgi:exodeoxyribonuclease V alpha subunit